MEKLQFIVTGLHGSDDYDQIQRSMLHQINYRIVALYDREEGHEITFEPIVNKVQDNPKSPHVTIDSVQAKRREHRTFVLMCTGRNMSDEEFDKTLSQFMDIVKLQLDERLYKGVQ